jgi:hypothetical protein
MKVDRTLAELLHALAWLRINRCALLLAGLILFIVGFPFTSSGTGGRVAVNLWLLAVLLAGRWALDPHRRIGWLPWALVGGIACAYVAVFAGVRGAGTVVTLGYAALEALITVALLAYVLDAGRVTADKIFGAISAYILLGMLFASLFTLLLLFDAAALRSSIDDDGRMGWFDLFYFAMTVLTSTGFGEIVPANDRGRALVIITQITGTMYVAFLVARLANLYPRR